jgi:DNA-binding GntR family transcriptional regulator
LLRREKTSVAVADHLLASLFDGSLRSGDPIDRDEVARALGVSRAPVQEALVLLERDGLVELPYHRGAVVARFDADTVREDFELYGLLSGMAAAHLARDPDPTVADALDGVVERLHAADEPDEAEKLGREFRRIVHRAGAGPRLRAALRSSISYLPRTASLVTAQAIPAMRRCLEAEARAIRAGDERAARADALEVLQLYGELVVAELTRRGVFTSPTP